MKQMLFGQTFALKVCIEECCSSIRCKNTIYPVAEHFTESGRAISTLQYMALEMWLFPEEGGDFTGM